MVKRFVALRPGALTVAFGPRYGQKDMAEVLNVSRQTVRNALSGAPVSAEFVAAATLATREPFDKLFEVRVQWNDESA